MVFANRQDPFEPKKTASSVWKKESKEEIKYNQIKKEQQRNSTKTHPTRRDNLPTNPSAISPGQGPNNISDLGHSTKTILDGRGGLLHSDDLRRDAVEHGAGNGTRVDAVHRSTIVAQLGGPAARQALQRRFRRAVQAHGLEAGARADGTDVDDAPPGVEVGEERLREQDHTPHVHAVHEVDVGRCDVGERAHNVNTGVVDEDVDVEGERGRGSITAPGVLFLLPLRLPPGQQVRQEHLRAVDGAEVGTAWVRGRAVREGPNLGRESLDVGFASGGCVA